MQQKNENAGLSAEQNADLLRLEGMAAEGDPAPEVAGQPQAVPVVDAAKSWAELPALVGSLLAIAMPEVKMYYTPAACMEWGEKMVPVAEELGWDVADVMGPKMALAVASTPFILGPVLIIKAKKDEQQKAEKASPAAKVKEQVDAMQKTVVFGAPVVGEPAE